jgi:hypothetical protein
VKENCQSSKACTKKIVQTTQSRLSLLSKYAQSNKKNLKKASEAGAGALFSHILLCAF